MGVVWGLFDFHFFNTMHENKAVDTHSHTNACIRPYYARPDLIFFILNLPNERPRSNLKQIGQDQRHKMRTKITHN